MTYNRHRRFILAAAIVVGIALLLLMLAHAPAGHAAVYLIVLPIVFIGVLPFLGVMSRIDFMRSGLTLDDPALPASFQRPPPSLFA
jgi:hypothetical protein